MEIGIDSFAAATVSHDADSAINNMNALAELLARMEFADAVGLDFFGIGEHHRKEFLDSAPHDDPGRGGGPHRADSPG